MQLQSPYSLTRILHYHPPSDSRCFLSSLTIMTYSFHDRTHAPPFPLSPAPPHPAKHTRALTPPARARGPAAYWWPGQAWSQPAIACFVLGGLSFLPGSYAVYIAVRAYRGDPGFSFDMIPTVQ